MSDILDRLKASFDGALGNPPHVAALHLSQMAPLLNRAGTLKIIEAILADEKTLAAIAQRSYTHTLGFKKIVILDPGLDLADGSRGYGYQLRLHIWEPECDGAVAMIESMHEHSFDFVSHLLLGRMENQCYTIGALAAADVELSERLQARLTALSTGDRSLVNQLLEAAEAARLRLLGSQQAEEELAVDSRRALADLLQVAAAELDAVVCLQGRYQAVASAVSAGAYTHRLLEMVRLLPAAVLRLQAGDTYYHPHRFAHRLFIPAGQFNATMILTTPVSQEAMGGSFQRPSWIPGDQVNYARQMYTAPELSSALEAFRTRLLACEASAGRLFDVANPG